MKDGASKTSVERSVQARLPTSSKFWELAEQLRRRFGRRKVALEQDLLEARERSLAAEREASAVEAKLQADLVTERKLSDDYHDELSSIRQAYHSLRVEFQASQQESFVKRNCLAEQIGATTAQLESTEQREASLAARLIEMEEKARQTEKRQQQLVQQLSRTERKEGELKNQLDEKYKFIEKLSRQLEDAQNSRNVAVEQSLRQLEEERASRQGLQERLGSMESENKSLRAQLEAMATEVEAMEQVSQPEMSMMRVEHDDSDDDDSFKATKQHPMSLQASCVRNGSLQTEGRGKGKQVAAKSKEQS